MKALQGLFFRETCGWNEHFHQASNYRPPSRRVDTPIDLNVNGAEKVPKETRTLRFSKSKNWGKHDANFEKCEDVVNIR